MAEKHWMAILLDRFYSQFLYRDLVYVGGGILILVVPFRVYSVLGDLKNQPWLLVVWILIAYALGFFAQHLGVFFCLFRMFPKKGTFVKSEVAAIKNELRIAEEWGEAKLRIVARVSFLKHISAVLGSSCLVTFVLLQLYFYSDRLKLSPYSYILGSVALAAVVVVMDWRNCTATTVEHELIKKEEQAEGKT